MDGPWHWASLRHRMGTHRSVQHHLGEESSTGPRKDLIYALHWDFVLSAFLAAPSFSLGCVTVPKAHRGPCHPCRNPQLLGGLLTPSAPTPPTAVLPAQASRGQPPVLSLPLVSQLLWQLLGCSPSQGVVVAVLPTAGAAGGRCWHMGRDSG